MRLDRVDVDPSHYVVLDVETTGLKSREDDLLSVSIYMPDTDKRYERLLPLELKKTIPKEITAINGIKKSDVKKCHPLTQNEVNNLIHDFELHSRTILTYGNIDEKFIRDYFCRHDLRGYTKMKFFNFKRLICATRFSDGSLTKDNLCKMFGIKGVTKVHNGLNDCVLEWKLFEKIDGRKLLASMYPNGWSIKVLDPNYIVPVSYLATYSGLSRIFPRPKIKCETEQVFNLRLTGKCSTRFLGNNSGMLLEHLISVLLSASDCTEENRPFLSDNYQKNEHIGVMPHYTPVFPVIFNDDGSITAERSHNKLDVLQAKQMNEALADTKKKVGPLIKFLKAEVFLYAPVLSQELSVDTEVGILAICDFSSVHSVLEVKTTYDNVDMNDFAEQIHYEAHGRKKYLLSITWENRRTDDVKDMRLITDAVNYTVYKVNTFEDRAAGKKRLTNDEVDAKLQSKGYTLVERFTNDDPIVVHCNQCGTERKIRYARIFSKMIACPTCRAIESERNRKEKLSPEAKCATRAEKYAKKVFEKSNHCLKVDEQSYTTSKENVTVTCLQCGRTWATRADHLLARCHCSACRQRAEATK